MCPVSVPQRTMDYLADAYKGGKQLVLQGESMGARQFIAAQARANSMADGDEYLTVRGSRVPSPRSLWCVPLSSGL